MSFRQIGRIAALLCIALPPLTAHAQIGDPFDAASLDNALKGMRVFKARMASAATLSAQYLANQKRIAALEESSRRAIDDYNANDSKISDCTHAFTDAQKPMRDEQMRKKMMSLMGDQAAYQKFIGETTRLSQAMAAAQAKGDSVGMHKAMDDLMKLVGGDAKADSAAATAKCGAAPAKPAALAQIGLLNKQDDSLSVKIRVAESSADIDAAKAASVPPATFAQMRERLGLFVTNEKAFQGKEADLLRSHQREIEDLLKAS